jgi:hypothetical protein
MNINEIKTNNNTSYLYEGLTPKHKSSMMLWESAGHAIKEAQLTPQQITQLFQQIEQGATAAGGNRTVIGQGKDAATAVKAAYDDLVSKVQNSGPIKNVDAMYDQAAEKLKQATGGDRGVMQYVQKYRDFAKKHPIAQGLIYSALIAAAGISGAGLGGAAALGLLKMTDKLLQGEKFSTAVGKGIATGAMAFAASKLGDLIRGVKPGEQVPAPSSDQLRDYNSSQLDFTNNDYYLDPNSTQVVGVPKGYGSPWEEGTKAYDIRQQLRAGGYGNSGISLPAADAAMDQSTQLQVAQEYLTADPATKAEIIKNTGMTDAALKALAAQSQSNFESRSFASDEINLLFEHIVIEAGLWDKFKQGAGAAVTQVVGASPSQIAGAAKGAATAAGQKLAQVGKNITTKVTADKLQSAWKKAGSPTDSEAIADILQAQGVDPAVISSAFQSMSVARVDRSKLPDVTKLTAQQKQQLLAQLDALEQGATAAPVAPSAKTHTGGKVAGQVSQTPNAVRQRQARAAKKAAPTAAPTAQLPGDRTTPMSQLLKQRQSQGMTESYRDFKKKLSQQLKR